MPTVDKTLFTRLGGIETLKKVHKIFYDELYTHTWLKTFFKDHPQEILEQQQTTFMTQLMGGPKIYAGKTPKNAHQHMFITDEIFELRHQILSESIRRAGIDDALRKEWLFADQMLKRSLVKENPGECKRSFPTQEIIQAVKPA